MIKLAWRFRCAACGLRVSMRSDLDVAEDDQEGVDQAAEGDEED